MNQLLLQKMGLVVYVSNSPGKGILRMHVMLGTNSNNEFFYSIQTTKTETIEAQCLTTHNSYFAFLSSFYLGIYFGD